MKLRLAGCQTNFNKEGTIIIPEVYIVKLNATSL
jgi:hypothetical protein